MKLQKINQTSSSYSLLGSATVPLNNLVRSKSKSVDTEVNLVDGEQRATPVSTFCNDLHEKANPRSKEEKAYTVDTLVTRTSR